MSSPTIEISNADRRTLLGLLQDGEPLESELREELARSASDEKDLNRINRIRGRPAAEPVPPKKPNQGAVERSREGESAEREEP